MNIVVERNFFGRQKESFEKDIYIDVLNNGDSKPFPCVFIRSPRLTEVRNEAEVIAHLADGTPVAVREDRLLATAFHPELTQDTRFHDYFLSFVGKP
jgi:5'-phosphate synthase pdxT subunit